MLDSQELGEEQILAALMGITEMMGDLTDLDELLETIVRIAPRLVSVNRCAIFLRNPRAPEFRVAHAFSPSPAATETMLRLSIPQAEMERLAHKLIRQRVPVLLREARESFLPATILETLKIRSMLLVPLEYQEQVMGFMTLDEPGKDHVFTSREVNVVQAIASHAAVALVHTRLVDAYRAQNDTWPADRDAVLALLASPPRFQCAGNDFDYDPASGALSLRVADAGRC